MFERVRAPSWTRDADPWNARNLQDWPRHRKECVAANQNQQTAVVRPLTDPQSVTVSALVFLPNEGMSLIL